MLGPSLLAGVGFGFAFVSVTIAAVTGTRPHEAGLASGLINTAQRIGGGLGLAILATIANSRTQSLSHSGVHTVSLFSTIENLGSPVLSKTPKSNFSNLTLSLVAKFLTICFYA